MWTPWPTSTASGPSAARPDRNLRQRLAAGRGTGATRGREVVAPDERLQWDPGGGWPLGGRWTTWRNCQPPPDRYRRDWSLPLPQSSDRSSAYHDGHGGRRRGPRSAARCGSPARADGTAHRFEHHRFLGDKRTQVVYDLDTYTDEAVIADLMSAETYLCFGPDTLAEARNRGYRAAQGTRPWRRTSRAGCSSASRRAGHLCPPPRRPSGPTDAVPGGVLAHGSRAGERHRVAARRSPSWPTASRRRWGGVAGASPSGAAGASEGASRRAVGSTTSAPRSATSEPDER